MSPTPTEFSRVNELFSREVFGNRNLAVLDSVYTAEAKLMPPGAPAVTGRENIRSFWQAAVDAMQPTGGMLETTTLEVIGPVAVETGRASAQTANGPLEVKYVVVWKNEGGAWKWDIDIWNHNA
jgi:ketosteroid isomerase-like protein